MTGLDVLEMDNFSALQGKTIAVITNMTALDSRGRHLVDILNDAPDIRVAAILSPEHGFRGTAEAGHKVGSGNDPKTGIPIISMYGKTRKPTPEMLAGIDMILFDIQDIGARFYTYISTMGYGMQAAAENGIAFMVLDRPNPISNRCEGAILDTAGYSSFVGRYPIPVRHGLSVGELAQMIKGENWTDTDLAKLNLVIVPVRNWDGNKFFGSWPPPSPNIPDLETALIYPGTCLLEGTNLSEGRGTEHPFLEFGAPYIDASALRADLDRTPHPGLKLDTLSFTPVSIEGKATKPKYENQLCHGIQVTITDMDSVKAVAFGVSLLSSVKRLFPNDFAWRDHRWINLLWGNSDLMEAIDRGEDAAQILARCDAGLDTFRKMSATYRLY